MKKELQSIRADLLKMMKEHGLKNGAFCATAPDDRYVGFGHLEEYESPATLFESALNIGRLWQHIRTVIHKTMDDFEYEKSPSPH